ncbi:hypothetical protein AB0I37_24865 [Micromonospora purpureochromogenes]|uniref:hypothetical protein n=1 Tax=Micromonospora purpureochromogenes TaxID=47872 RepID=UPI0033FEC344
MATTSIYGLPYQGLTDPPDGPNLSQQLAEGVEAVLVDRRPMRNSGALSSLYTLTASFTDLSGTSMTFNVPTSSAIYLAHWSADCQLTTAGNVTAVIQLLVDGTAQSPQALWNPGNVTNTARASVGNSTSGALVGAGNHNFRLQANRVFPSGTTGEIRLNNIHTQLSVLVIPL